jgi:hypothetical protein
MGEILEQLAQLRKLQSLRMSGTMRAYSKPPHLTVLLPAWPHLRHLHLDLDMPYFQGDSNLQLSAENCARLEALTARFFHAAPGVTSMQQLTRLHIHTQPSLCEGCCTASVATTAAAIWNRAQIR